MNFDLADVLLSRLFHDLASPASAVANGAELLGDMIGIGDTALAIDSLELTAQSAETVTRRLSFFRMAFGGAGTTADVPLSTAERLAREYVASRDHAFATDGLDPSLSPGLGGVKVMMNAVMVVTDCLSRPGTIKVSAASPAGVTVRADGPGARLSEPAAACLGGTLPEVLDTRVAPALFLSRQAERFGVRYEVATEADAVWIDLTFP